MGDDEDALEQSLPQTLREATWEGTDRKGARVKGVTQGPNENSVRMQLRRQGVNPIRVRRNIELFKTKRKITSSDIAIFSRQLATMMAAAKAR